MPKHYWDALVDHYFWLHPPKETSALDDDEFLTGNIDVDKMDTRKRALMSEQWAAESRKGDAV